MSALPIPIPLTPRSLPAWRLAARRVLVVGGWAVIASVIVAWALLFRPQFLGGPAAYVMVSGTSMEPTLHSGDLVIAHRERRYRVGDTVLYRVPDGDTGAGSLIIHRIVGGSATSGWIVQGDNKDVPDLWRPRSSEVVGAMWTTVPGAGTAVARAMSPLGLASISTLLALFLGLPGAVVDRADARSRRRRPPSEAADAPVATALALIAAPRPTPAAPLRADTAPRAASRALAIPLPMPALTLPSPMRSLEIPAVASKPPQLALPPAPAPPDAAASRPTVISAPQSTASAWGEAAWTARDLDVAASNQSSAALVTGARQANRSQT